MVNTMSKRTVGIGELIVSRTPGDLLITHALGSCLGVAVADPAAGVAGLAHCQLPTAMGDVQAMPGRPARFVDAGVTLLLEEVIRQGGMKCRLVIKVAGGSNILDEGGTFRIGERNCTVVRKLMWKNSLLIASSDLGGNAPRTMSIEVGGTRVLIQSAGTEREL